METKKETNLSETTETKTVGEPHSNHRRMHRYHKEIKKARTVLLAFAILYTFGIHPAVKNIGYIVFGFSVPVFFIMSGYLVLRGSKDIEKRILRAIKRTAICFIILAAAYFALSIVFEPKATIAAVTTKIFWFDFLALNIWSLPVGSTIWYVQALLYAYIIVYIFYKSKLLKFDIYIAAICLAVTFICGDFSSFIGFNLFGHTYIGGNFLTRALPYILIGGFMHRKKDDFSHLKTKHYILIGIAGLALSFIEYFGLSFFKKTIYTGHTLGTTLTAISVCMFIFMIKGMKLRSKYFKTLSRFEMMIPYFICSPIYYFLVSELKSDGELAYFMGGFASLFVAVASFVILYVYAFIRKIIHENKEQNKDDENFDDDN